MRKRLTLAIALVLGTCAVAHAHRLNVFASAEGGEIRGYAYFPGGGRAAGVEVSFVDPSGETARTVQADAQGAFAWTPPRPVDWRVVATSPDGHAAEFVITAAELGAAGTHAGAGDAGASERPSADAARESAGAARPAADGVIADEVRALRGQVAALREDLQRQADRRRLQEVLGGVGYFLGLAGVAFYFLARRERRKQ